MVSYNKKLVNPSLGNSKRGVKILQGLLGKKVVILGFGREGKDTFSFLRQLSPRLKIAIADRNEKTKNQKPKTKNIYWHVGKHYLEAIGDYDVIIKSPGVPPKVVEPHLRKNQIVTSATEIFFDLCPGMIIGVTGTKGKGTTATLIYQILKNASKKNSRIYSRINYRIKSRIHLVGNIGKPALSFLRRTTKEDIFIYELSSHQLYGMKKSPHIAVFLNLYPEHLDYYGFGKLTTSRSFNEYAKSKSNICRWQKKDDYLVFNSKDKLVRSIAKKSKAKKIAITGRYFELDKNAARAVGKILDVPKPIIEKTIRDFRGLPHRLERVGKFKGITFYNDSLATTPQAVAEAIKFLGDKVQTLIAGGYDRGVPFDDLVRALSASKVKTLILFPPSGQRIAKELRGQKREVLFAETMEEAVKNSFERTSRGKICLLSPASPSFGLFKDYADRGERFKICVRRIAKP